jgi:hypothetical protein
MHNDEKVPSVIWRINFGGFAIFMLGLMGGLVFSKTQDKTLFWVSVAVTMIGWFMTAIRVPLNYPRNLFAFDLYDLGMPIMFSFLLVMILLIEITEGRLSVSRASVFVLGLWVTFAVSGVLMRVASRIGTRLAKR